MRFKIAPLEKQTAFFRGTSRGSFVPVAWFLAIGLSALVAAFYLDPAVYGWVIDHKVRGLKDFMRTVSRYGDWPSHVAVGLLGALFALWKRRVDWARIFLAMILACAIAGLAGRVVKMAAGRARPSVKTEIVWKGPTLQSNYHAFPSGHTAATTAFFGVLWFKRRRLALTLLPIPLLIAFSRIYLNAHYLSDVVGGAIVGTGSAWFVVTRSIFAATEKQSLIRPR